jgi:ABC-type multidrug transport system fused ATPase/permease subunit
MKGRTVVMIAHRLTTIRDANQIIVISGGCVAECGTHDQLLALNGVYAALHRTQFDEHSASAGS